MLREKKRTLLLTSLLTLFPILVGLLLWEKLPERMVTHWGIDGRPDGWSSRTFVVFGMPLLLLALHWLCMFLTTRDSKNKAQNGKVFSLVLWTTPAVSLFAAGLSYAAAFGVEVPISGVTCLLLGTMFFLVGNYLPKCKQSYTIGIKISWTLNSEANWLATHRFAGRIWTVCGVLLMTTAFLPVTFAFFCSLVLFTAMAVVPIVYSYRFYKKEQAAQKDPESPQG